MGKELYVKDDETLTYKIYKNIYKRLDNFLFVFFAVAAVIAVVWCLCNSHRTLKAERLKNAQLIETVDSLKTKIEEYGLDTLTGKLILVTAEECGPVDDSLLWAFVQMIDPWYPEYIMAQAIVESGCGTSDVYKDNNNLFGMREARRRKTTADVDPKNPRSYARYKNWKLSVIDRIQWEIFRFREDKPSEDKYLNSLCTYAEDPEYISKIRSTAARYKKKR